MLVSSIRTLRERPVTLERSMSSLYDSTTTSSVSEPSGLGVLFSKSNRSWHQPSRSRSYRSWSLLFYSHHTSTLLLSLFLSSSLRDRLSCVLAHSGLLWRLGQKVCIPAAEDKYSLHHVPFFSIPSTSAFLLDWSCLFFLLNLSLLRLSLSVWATTCSRAVLSLDFILLLTVLSLLPRISAAPAWGWAMRPPLLPFILLLVLFWLMNNLLLIRALLQGRFFVFYMFRVIIPVLVASLFSVFIFSRVCSLSAMPVNYKFWAKFLTKTNPKLFDTADIPL